MTERRKGHVKSWLKDRGYGFLIDETDDSEFFVHHSDIEINPPEGFCALKPDQMVSFEFGKRKGRVQALRVANVDGDPFQSSQGEGPLKRRAAKAQPRFEPYARPDNKSGKNEDLVTMLGQQVLRQMTSQFFHHSQIPQSPSQPSVSFPGVQSLPTHHFPPSLPVPLPGSLVPPTSATHVAAPPGPIITLPNGISMPMATWQSLNESQRASLLPPLQLPLSSNFSPNLELDVYKSMADVSDSHLDIFVDHPLHSHQLVFASPCAVPEKNPHPSQASFFPPSFHDTFPALHPTPKSTPSLS
jgi:cold shock CspA family protein